MKKDVKWSYGIPGARIARALREWKACELPDEEHYMMLDADGEDIGTILRAFGVDVTPQAYTKGELTRLFGAEIFSTNRAPIAPRLNEQTRCLVRTFRGLSRIFSHSRVSQVACPKSTAGTLYLDEAVAFAAPDWVSASEASRLIAAHPGAVLLWRTIPAGGVCATACAFPEPAVLMLDGAGRLAPAAGTILPEVEAQPFPALEQPVDGFIWTTGRNLSAAGFGALTWNAAPTSPPRGELVPAAATVLAITSILPQADGSAVLTARLTSAIDVAFDGSAAFSAVDPRTGATARPAKTSLAGAEARVVLPPDPAAARLFRLRLE